MKKAFFIVLLLLLCSTPISYAINYYPSNQLNSDKAIFIDVRSIYAKEYYKSFKPGSIWVDPHSLMEINGFIKDNLSRKDATFVIYCSCPHDEYSIAMTELLEREGFSHVYVLKNGWDILTEQNLITKEGRK